LAHKENVKIIYMQIFYVFFTFRPPVKGSGEVARRLGQIFTDFFYPPITRIFTNILTFFKKNIAIYDKNITIYAFFIVLYFKFSKFEPVKFK
jgi:hypothetical protein